MPAPWRKTSLAFSLAVACPCDTPNQIQPLVVVITFQPQGDLLVSIELDGGKLLCHRSMRCTSACPRDVGQNNQKVLLTPLPRVSKTPFLSFQKGKKIWKFLPKLQITFTYSQGPEAQELEMPAPTYLLISLCHNMNSSGMIKTQKTSKCYFPPDALTSVHPREDVQHLRSVSLTFWNSAFLLFMWGPMGAQGPNSSSSAATSPDIGCDIQAAWRGPPEVTTQVSTPLP